MTCAPPAAGALWLVQGCGVRGRRIPPGHPARPHPSVTCGGRGTVAAPPRASTEVKREHVRRTLPHSEAADTSPAHGRQDRPRHSPQMSWRKPRFAPVGRAGFCTWKGPRLPGPLPRPQRRAARLPLGSPHK